MESKSSDNRVSPSPGDHGNSADAEAQQSVKHEKSCLERVSNAFIQTLENGFARLGLSIGRYPIRYIIGCFAICLLTTLGLLAFEEVTDPDDLWVPKDSQVMKDQDWIDQNFPSTVRREEMLAEDDTNILTPTALSAMLDVYENTLTLATDGGNTLSDICIKAGSACIVYSVLELWSYNSTVIRSLTQAEILAKINSETTSPMYGNTIDWSSYLGTQTTSASGDITSAQAAYMVWLTNGNDTMESITESWEDKFIDLGKAGQTGIQNLYVTTAKSQDEEADKAINSDLGLLSIGYFLVILFVLLVLGKFNFMEQKAWLTLAGFVCIGLAVLVSVGVSSAIQFKYGPVHSVLPFLLLGIGVDDMFVVMGSLNNLLEKEQQDIPNKISNVLRHAGVSITVTSFTDFIAFMIGATTIIPALQSFCVYAGMGILALYGLVAVFFTACMTLDLQRIEQQKDGCCFCCISHPSPPYEPNTCSQKQFVPFIFKHGLAKIITNLPFKIIITVIAVSLLGVNIWGLVELEQYFDRNWFLPSDSYAKYFNHAKERHFPNEGDSGHVYCGNLNYWARQTEMENLNSALGSSQYIASGSTDSWFSALTTWLANSTDTTVTDLLDANKYPDNETSFISLTYRLTTEQATRTASYIQFATSTGSDITASRFPFKHIPLDDSSSEISAMDETRELVKSIGFSNTECFPYSRAYLGYETNKVIRTELFRNLGLALVCVFILTLILIANLKTSFLVFIGVVFTLVDVAGSIHHWGLTIDTVSTIILILSIGLAVDYSAHIGHMFMTVVGSRHDRTKETIGEMGPPVFYGGFSTFLAFVLLSNSNSYVFQTFFKINFLVVVYGLFHGLIFVPVLLSWFGPDPYPTADRVYRKHHPDGIHRSSSNLGTDKVGTTNAAYVSHENGIENGHMKNGMNGSLNGLVNGNGPPGKQQQTTFSSPSHQNSGTAPPSYSSSPTKDDGGVPHVSK